jgi:hypothetical protein
MKKLQSCLRSCAAIICAAPLLHGCLSTHPEPTTGPRAQVRFISKIGGSVVNVDVLSFTNEQCEGRKLVAELNGIAVQHNRKKIGMPLANEFDEKEISEIHVEAGKPLVFTMGVWAGSIYSGISMCYLTTTFLPAENQMYEATYAETPEVCAVGLKRIEKTNSGYVRVNEESRRVLKHSCTINGVEHFDSPGGAETAQEVQSPPTH